MNYSKMNLNKTNLYSKRFNEKILNNKSSNERKALKENKKNGTKLESALSKIHEFDKMKDQLRASKAKSNADKRKGNSELNLNKDLEIFLSDKNDFKNNLERNLKTVYQFSPLKGENEKKGSIDINNSLIDISIMKSKNLNNNSIQLKCGDENEFDNLNNQFRSHKNMDSLEDPSKVISSMTKLNNTEYRLDFVNKIRNNSFLTEFDKYYRENGKQNVVNSSDQIELENYLGIEQDFNKKVKEKMIKFKIVGKKIDTIELNSEYSKGEMRSYLNKTITPTSNIFRLNYYKHNKKQDNIINKKEFSANTLLNDNLNLEENNNIIKMYYHKKLSKNRGSREKIRRMGVKEGYGNTSDNHYSIMNEIQKESYIKKYKISKMKRAVGLI